MGDLRICNRIFTHTHVCRFMNSIHNRSFAYYTFRVRLPSTLATIAASLVKDKDELLATYGVVSCFSANLCP